MKRLTLVTVLAIGLASCGPTPPPAPSVHYTVGPAWQGAEGVWFYPSESFSSDQTGIAAIAGDDHPPLTADGERFDQSLLTAGHQTLQLPSIVMVTNLDNGRALLVRVNDRGPAAPGRVIELTKRAAELLRLKPGDPVRVQVQEGPSRQLADQLQAGQPGQPAVEAAPLGKVQSTSLAPPAGVAASTRGRQAPSGPRMAAAAEAPAAAALPTRLPEHVLQGTPYQGHLLIRAGDFGRLEFAERVEAKLTGLPARIERSRIGRSENYRVAIGPFTSLAAADAALDRALKGGVTDARIVVE